MAAYLGSIVASTLNKTRKEVWRQIWGCHPVWYKLEKKMKRPYDGGLNIVEILEIGENGTVAFRDPKAAIPLEETDELTRVSWSPKTISGSITIFDDDELTNNGDSAITDYTRVKINGLKAKLQKVLRTGLWAAGGENLMDGLPAICSATNTYPVADSRTQVTGILRTTAGNEYWQAVVKSTTEPWALTGGTDGGWQKLYNDLLNYGQSAGGDMTDEPDIIVTSQALFEKYEQSMLDQNPQMDADLAEAGFHNLMYKGAAVVWDPNIDDATKTYMLNTKYIDIRPHTSNASDFNYSEMHPMETQLAKRQLVSWTGNITCVMPRKQGVSANKS